MPAAIDSGGVVECGSVLFHSLGIAIATATFVFDLLMPLGVAAAVPYALLVLVSLRSPGPRPTWLAASSASVLTVLGYLLSPPGGELWKVLTNRLLALFVIWVTAYLCLAQKRQEARSKHDRIALLGAERMVSLGEVSAGIAHELGNPLAAIRGRVEMLEMRLGSDPIESKEVRKFTSIVGELSERMIRIIRGMRSLSRDASSDPFLMAPIGRIIEDVLEVSRARLQNLGDDVRVGAIDPQLEILCRESQIGQVLVNLIANATDAVSSQSERWIQIDVAESDDHVEISVTDSGRGIPKKMREKVIEPFFTTKDAGKGTGLGLSISRTIVESHSGRLWIDEECANTRFVVSLPKVQKQISRSE